MPTQGQMTDVNQMHERYYRMDGWQPHLPWTNWVGAKASTSIGKSKLCGSGWNVANDEKGGRGSGQDRLEVLHGGEDSTTDQNLLEYYLLSCPTHLTIDSWMWCLIMKLLDLTHSQCILHNITKYHHTNGTIKLDAKQDTIKEIERQLDMGLCNLPPKSKCLLEIDT